MRREERLQFPLASPVKLFSPRRSWLPKVVRSMDQLSSELDIDSDNAAIMSAAAREDLLRAVFVQLGMAADCDPAAQHQLYEALSIVLRWRHDLRQVQHGLSEMHSYSHVSGCRVGGEEQGGEVSAWVVLFYRPCFQILRSSTRSASPKAPAFHLERKASRGDKWMKAMSDRPSTAR